MTPLSELKKKRKQHSSFQEIEKLWNYHQRVERISTQLFEPG
jgi:hypothetical protein